MGEQAQQHRQVDPGDELDAPRLDQPRGDVAGGGAVEVGEQQHAFAIVDRGDHPAGERQGVGGILARRQAELAEQRRALVEDVADALDQRFAEGAVGDEKEADHGVLRSLRF